MSSMVDFLGIEEKVSTSVSAERLRKLEELTDEDVMQLTREDCRRYLKEKGMRRPSWNKAQAVQQLLSLKSLCDPSPASSGAAKRSPSPPLDEAPAKKPMAMYVEFYFLSLESYLSLLLRFWLCFSPLCLSLLGGRTSIDLKAAAAVDAANLTMFYDGAVSVFDDVSPDKAYAIMLLAGDVKSWPSINVAANTNKVVISSSELPQARKASLQRFLQRRREKTAKEAASKGNSNKSPCRGESSGKHASDATDPATSPLLTEVSS
ncbi:hypothetical protein SELMODRAFT_447809 [Selaginella moellendorffii]|uniref:Tify domain-containing protein n=1 Tax=Selaginella moellendorffii TaxID=88036 RepID=D8T2E9_SELML|nr:protein TIFY 4B isoform X1 [Selaginella moellendorffii]EFJ09252.1 hypothetical protein SELMODRAFT_447809 [Selaginella moellendorffii]|eukprot:XP_002989775.1 protein TIFY 4B isoform X1 [Selaginella moellendorffii]